MARNYHQGKPKRKHRKPSPPPEVPMLVALNKPFDVLCQFTGEDHVTTLSEYINEPNIYPAGRLDKDSEGLMLLTNHGGLQARITEPKFKLPKTYWVLVEGVPDDSAIQSLRAGVDLKDGVTAPAEVRMINEPDNLWPRTPPVRVRKTITDSWLAITITEGKNRQVRRMTAHVGHPTLRLIRAQIGPFSIHGLAPGESRQIPLEQLPSRLLSVVKK